jgi:hypothetical protein
MPNLQLPFLACTREVYSSVKKLLCLPQFMPIPDPFRRHDEILNTTDHFVVMKHYVTWKTNRDRIFWLNEMRKRGHKG